MGRYNSHPNGLWSHHSVRHATKVNDAHTAVQELTDLTQEHVHRGTVPALNTDLLPRTIAELIGTSPAFRAEVSEPSA